jgi:VanZ family protein
MRSKFSALTLFLNFITLLYLVWTPTSFIDCSSKSISIEKLFCLAPWLDRLGNFLLLAPTALLLFLIFKGISTLKLSFFILVLALLIEGVQFLVPGRDPNLRDVASNSFGAWIFLALANQVTHRRARVGR